ncbi:MAG: hypothetical protein A3I66_12640 [Burkholderiales bacterium RIFCSPLOWO2_02_FULL_57_36]|nr:MAG: hypothetical protein A3I66_12640 [Burkholderiales bacterium RIFCSPLOWO2_02_FULL_57_36]
MRNIFLGGGGLEVWRLHASDTTRYLTQKKISNLKNNQKTSACAMGAAQVGNTSTGNRLYIHLIAQAG